MFFKKILYNEKSLYIMIMSNKNTILSCINIHKSFIVKDKKFDVLKGITIRISKGDFVVILGPSGSGKTTLLNILAGLEKPSFGSVFFDGIKLNIDDHNSLDILRSEKIGYIFQNYGLIPICNVFDNVSLGLVNKKVNKDNVMQILKRLKIDGVASKFPNELSGGQKQRVSIARALIKNPEIIFLDEPTGALDNETTLEIFEIFKQLRDSKKTLLVVTHDERFIELATKVIRIKDGLIDQSSVSDYDQDVEFANFTNDIARKINAESIRILDMKPYQNFYYNYDNDNWLHEPSKQIEKSINNNRYIEARKTSNQICISLENVNKTINTKGVETRILKNIDLRINVGDFAIIFGESGSGKSTLLGVMSGLDKKITGKSFVLNECLNEMPSHKLLKWRQDNISFVFQVNSLLPNLSVIDNVLLTTKKKNKDFAIKLLEYLGLGSFIKTKVKLLSGGQQQRVSIARAICKNAKILFADEPTGAVDSKTAKDIVNIFRQINERYGITIIMVTHNHDLLHLGNRLIQISDGQVVRNELLDKSIDIDSLQ